MKGKKKKSKKSEPKAKALVEPANTFKLGLVLECEVGGADELVLTCLARRLRPDVVVYSQLMGSKAGIFGGGVEAAAKLIEISKCELVLVVWDLKPFWTQVAAKSCVEEVAEMNQQLQAVTPATRAKIRLLCLTWELETWLIADQRAVRAHLSTPAHQSIFRCNSPLSRSDAKAFLDGECRNHRGKSRRYEDVREAIKIARLIPDTAKIQDIPSYCRFSELITGTKDAAFKQQGDACKDLVFQAYKLGRGA